MFWILELICQEINMFHHGITEHRLLIVKTTIATTPTTSNFLTRNPAKDNTLISTNTCTKHRQMASEIIVFMKTKSSKLKF